MLRPTYRRRGVVGGVAVRLGLGEMLAVCVCVCVCVSSAVGIKDIDLYVCALSPKIQSSPRALTLGSYLRSHRLVWLHRIATAEVRGAWQWMWRGRGTGMPTNARYTAALNKSQSTHGHERLTHSTSSWTKLPHR